VGRGVVEGKDSPIRESASHLGVGTAKEKEGSKEKKINTCSQKSQTVASQGDKQSGGGN